MVFPEDPLPEGATIITYDQEDLLTDEAYWGLVAFGNPNEGSASLLFETSEQLQAYREQIAGGPVHNRLTTHEVSEYELQRQIETGQIWKQER